MIRKSISHVLIFLALIGGEFAHAQAYRYRIVSSGDDPGDQETVVGCMRAHTVAPKETLLDIARHYGLGFNEIQLLYPQVDPWIPEPGLRLSIPTQWVLPSSKYMGVVINIPEFRLYRFFRRIDMVKTYPVGIGVLGAETPEGTYRVVEREVHPIWVVPPSLRSHYGFSKVSPGPRNPLGEYWIGLSRKGYGIHGTNFPWGVGRLVSHGCIRLYPEHIRELFQEACIGTPVEIIYEPVKIGVNGGRVFLEVHPDVYGRIADMETHTRERLHRLGLWQYVSVEKMKAALEEQKGVAVQVGTIHQRADRKRGKEVIEPRGANQGLSNCLASERF
jgi:L,D-transpeptidase ErfK/SrfK